jgi:hypothetical protein
MIISKLLGGGCSPPPPGCYGPGLGVGVGGGVGYYVNELSAMNYKDR